MTPVGIALRGTAAAAAGTAAAAGLLFALFGSSGEAPAETATPFAPIVAAATETASPVAPTSGGPGAVVSQATESSATEHPANAVAQPVGQTLPDATPTATEAAPITDRPAYSDVQVLAMAASVRLPSGRTFEQCVALGPNGKHWPVPVHLYYEGKGKWLVETHLGEVQVEFDEAAGSFRVKHFAPEASECLSGG